MRIIEFYGGLFPPFYQRIKLVEYVCFSLMRESSDIRIMGSGEGSGSAAPDGALALTEHAEAGHQ